MSTCVSIYVSMWGCVSLYVSVFTCIHMQLYGWVNLFVFLSKDCVRRYLYVFISPVCVCLCIWKSAYTGMFVWMGLCLCLYLVSAHVSGECMCGHVSTWLKRMYIRVCIICVCVYVYACIWVVYIGTYAYACVYVAVWGCMFLYVFVSCVGLCEWTCMQFVRM